MGLPEFIIYLAIGTVAGWLTSLLRPTDSCDVLDNIWFGVVGALTGSIAIGYFGLGLEGLLAVNFLLAISGAIAMLIVGAFLKNA